MRKIMVFQHVAHEPLGVLDRLLRKAGFRIRFVNFEREPNFEPNMDNYNGLIILGGPMGVYDADKIPHLKAEMKAIEHAIKKNIPVLGICLGSQLIASVLGSEVRKAKEWEFGWCDVQLTDQGKKDALFQNFSAEEKIFQLHQDTFDIPKSAEHLARSQICEGQAFRYGEKVYGLQFHLEVDERVIARWLHRPEHKRLMAHLNRGYTEERIMTETYHNMPKSLQLSEATFQKFIDIFNLPPKRIVLGSR